MNALNADSKYQYLLDKQQRRVDYVEKKVDKCETEIENWLENGEGSPRKLMRDLENYYEELDL